MRKHIVVFFIIVSIFSTLFDFSQQSSTIIGEVEILQADNFERGFVQRFYLLKSNSPSATYILNVSSEYHLKELTPGRIVKVVGFEELQPTGKKVLSSNYKLFHATDLQPLKKVEKFQDKESIVQKDFHFPLFLQHDASVVPNPIESPLNVRIRRAVVLIVDFLDEKVKCSPEEISETVWSIDRSTSTKRVYEVDSFGTTSFVKNSLTEVDTFGPFQLDLQLNQQIECKPDDWAVMAIGKAKERGISLRGYHNFIFVLPDSDYLHRTLCGWNGLGNVGCNDRCRVWVSNCDKVGVFIHELGHNFGLAHSASKVLLKEEYAEYGDPTSWMGNKWWNSDLRFLFTAIHRVQLGWIPLNRIPVITESGYYKLAAFNQLPQNVRPDLPMALAILKPDEVDKNPQPYFIFSFAHGDDVVKSDELIIHVLVSWSSPTLFVLSLNHSQTYRDPSQRFSIRYESLEFESGSLYPVMTVWIHFGCTPGPTEVTVLPQIDYYHPSRQLVPISMATFNLSSSITIQDAVSPSTSVDTSNNNNNNNNNSTVPVVFLYMTEKHRIFNVTFGVMNKDTPVCSPIDYVYTVSVPTIWSVSCEPPLTLYLMPQQFCTIECQFSLNEEETNDFDAMKMTDIVFQINGTSSFPSELHHQVNFVRATWPQICQRGRPIISTIPASLLTATPSNEVSLNIEIFNDDSFGCNATTFVLSVTFPSEWNWHFVDDQSNRQTSKQFSLDPQSIQRMTISVVPTNSNNKTGVAQFNLTAFDNEQLHSEVIQYLPLQLLPPCVSSLPIVVHNVPYVNTTVRSGFAVPMLINNTQNCNDVQLHFVATPSNNSPTIQTSIVSETTGMVNVGGRESRFLLAMVFLADEMNTISSFVDITTNDPSITLPKIQMDVFPVPCVRDWAAFGCFCPSLVDISDPIFLWDPTNPQTKKYIVCSCYYQNRDSWSCDDSLFELTLETNFTQFELNATFQFPKQIVYPGNDTWQELQLSFNVSIPTLNRTLTEPLALRMRIYLSDTYHPALNYHHLYNDQFMIIWKCNKSHPLIDISSQSQPLVRVWAGGTAVFQFTITNQDSSFCSKSQFDLALNNPSTLRNMGFDWYFNPMNAALDPGASSNSYLLITTPKDLDSPLNVTLSVNVSSFDSNTQILYSSMTTVTIVIENDCQIAHPQIEIIPYDPEMYLTFGKATQFEYGVVNITNKDSLLCNISTFVINIKILEWNVPVPGGMNVWFTDYNTSTIQTELAPMSSVKYRFSISFVDNVPPGNYTIMVYVNDPKELSHEVSERKTLPVQCQKPKPVWDLLAREKLSELGTPLGTEILWTACIYSVDCCCPCFYEIQKNGQVIAVVTQTNFVDHKTFAQIGVYFNYTITVIDAYGTRSDSHTCGVTIAAITSTSSLDYIVVMLIVVGVLLVPSMVILIETLKWKRKLKKSNTLPIVQRRSSVIESETK